MKFYWKRHSSFKRRQVYGGKRRRMRNLYSPNGLHIEFFFDIYGKIFCIRKTVFRNIFREFPFHNARLRVHFKEKRTKQVGILSKTCVCLNDTMLGAFFASAHFLNSLILFALFLFATMFFLGMLFPLTTNLALKPFSESNKSGTASAIFGFSQL